MDEGKGCLRSRDTGKFDHFARPALWVRYLDSCTGPDTHKGPVLSIAVLKFLIFEEGVSHFHVAIACKLCSCSAT